jgi:signal transduction histidine kinase
LVVLIYSTARWASGKQAMTGFSLVFVAMWVSGNTFTYTTQEQVWGMVLFWIVPILPGIIPRYRARLVRQRIREARLRERHLIARELHDTVAHHVSAIAIQAQAGQFVADKDPDAVAGVLASIEEAASRSLDEMRKIVSALRDSESAAFAPQRGIADIEPLANIKGLEPRVDVDLTGDLDGLRPSVEHCLFRLSQESITNARRHARNVTRIAVCITGSADDVLLTVTDDGDTTTRGTRSGSGHGLITMAERTELLGGTFEAGPGTDGGWVVSAAVPRSDTAK